MWFFLGVKFHGNIIVYIRGQRDVSKVKVIWESSRRKPVFSQTLIVPVVQSILLALKLVRTFIKTYIKKT